MTTSTKITRSTLKSFIKKNFDNMYIRLDSSFSGMTDGIEYYNEGFEKAEKTERSIDHTFGLNKAWFVGQSRDYFTKFENEKFVGYEVSNSCGSFVLAISK